MSVDVFFDLDGTLIDATYKPNASVTTLKEAIARLGSGARTHLNSNRSLVQLREYYDLFGLSGCIILENGCCYFDPESGDQSPSCVEPFDRQIVTNCVDEPVLFVSTDAIVNEEEQQLSDGAFVFAEVSRTYTMTLYPRRVVSRKPVLDLQLLARIAAVVETAYPAYEVTVDAKKYGNVLLKPKGVFKATLLPQLSRSAFIASFGDAKDDICMFESSDFCGAPANASTEAKEAVLRRGGIVTASSYTAGAIQFLEALQDAVMRAPLRRPVSP